MLDDQHFEGEPGKVTAAREDGEKYGTILLLVKRIFSTEDFLHIRHNSVQSMDRKQMARHSSENLPQGVYTLGQVGR